jgi:capsid protein
MVAVHDKRRVVLDADGVAIRSEYDILNPSTRRRSASPMLRSEDRELHHSGRRQMTAEARDIYRNYSPAAWAIRKHLDYVSTFTFHSRTGDAAADKAVEANVAFWSRRENCDVAGRHPLNRLIRLFEAHRTVDGDCLVVWIADGRVQGIEGDRIRAPLASPASPALPVNIVHGVQVDGAGKNLAYAVHRRTGWGGYEFEQWVPDEWAYLHGYFTRLDQVRGVTPLSSALADFRDVYEAKEYALAKAKISQLFGLIFYREAADEMGLPEQPKEGDEEAEAEDRYDTEPGKGPFKLELDPGDRAEWLESKTPSTETLTLFDRTLEAALKSLDIPMSFYDGSRTNFFGSRAELNHYLASAEIKRADNRDLLGWATSRRLALDIRTGRLVLPGRMTAADLKGDWVHAGLPWWNPVQEVTASAAAIAAGLTSRTRVLKAQGEDFIEVADELASEKKALESRGLSSDVKAPNVSVSISEDRPASEPAKGGKQEHVYA